MDTVVPYSEPRSVVPATTAVVPPGEQLGVEARTYIVVGPKATNKQPLPGVTLMAEKQKYLRSKTNGVIFVWDEELAKRPDMEPYEGNAAKENKRVESDSMANAGTLEVAGEEKAMSTDAWNDAKPEAPKDDDKMARIAKAIDGLGPDDFNAGGKAKLGAIEDMIGESVTAKERDQALEDRK